MREPAGADHTPAEVESTEIVSLPPAILARLAAMASERAFVGFLPTQSKVPA